MKITTKERIIYEGESGLPHAPFYTLDAIGGYLKSLSAPWKEFREDEQKKEKEWFGDLARAEWVHPDDHLLRISARYSPNSITGTRLNLQAIYVHVGPGPLFESDVTPALENAARLLYEGDLQLEMEKIKRYQADTKEHWGNYFEYFFLHLPSENPTIPEWDRALRYSKERWVFEHHHSSHKLLDARPPAGMNNNSVIRQKQTLHQFYATIDAALASAGVLDEVRAMLKTKENFNHLAELILPAYQSLRKQGYLEKHDLRRPVED